MKKVAVPYMQGDIVQNPVDEDYPKSLRLRIMSLVMERKQWTRLSDIIKSSKFVNDNPIALINSLNEMATWSIFEAEDFGGDVVAIRPVSFDNLTDSVSPEAEEDTMDLTDHESLVGEIPTSH